MNKIKFTYDIFKTVKFGFSIFYLFSHSKIIVETCSQRLYMVIGYVDTEYDIVNNM